MSAELIVIAISIACAAPAQQENVDLARKYFEAGKQAYDAGMFSGAATAFEEAFRFAPRPQVAFSLAQAYRRQYLTDKDPQNAKRAVDILKKYVGDVSQGGRRADALQFLAELEPAAKKAESIAPAMAPKVKAEPTQIMVSSRTKDAQASVDGGPLSEVPLLRDVTPGKHKVHVESPGYFGEDVEELAVENRLAVVELSLREKPARIVLDAPEGADVAVNGRTLGTTPFPHAIEVPAGQSLVTVTSRGSYPFAQEIDLVRDREVKVSAPLETTTQRKVALWFLGGGLGSAIAGGTTSAFAYATLKKARDMDAAITHKLEMGVNALAPDLRNYNDEVAKRDRLVSASVVLLGGGAAFLTVGVLLYVVDNPRALEPSLLQKSGVSSPNASPATPELTAPSMWIAPGIVGASWGGSF